MPDLVTTPEARTSTPAHDAWAASAQPNPPEVDVPSGGAEAHRPTALQVDVPPPGGPGGDNGGDLSPPRGPRGDDGGDVPPPGGPDGDIGGDVPPPGISASWSQREHYNAVINPGPLAEMQQPGGEGTVAQNFRNGSYDRVVTDVDIPVYKRLGDDDSRTEVGGWCAPAMYRGTTEQDLHGLALQPGWGSRDRYVEDVIPAGTEIFVGTAAAQRVAYDGVSYDRGPMVRVSDADGELVQRESPWGLGLGRDAGAVLGGGLQIYWPRDPRSTT
ncbi:hypothetical protein ACI79G_04105 [Geodermatophilus sp. SYSU D00779]